MNYNLLWQYITNQNKDELKLTYNEIEQILGAKLNHSFLSHKKELEKYGYKVKKISLKENYVIFVKL